MSDSFYSISKFVTKPVDFTHQRHHLIMIVSDHNEPGVFSGDFGWIMLIPDMDFINPLLPVNIHQGVDVGYRMSHIDFMWRIQLLNTTGLRERGKVRWADIAVTE